MEISEEELKHILFGFMISSGPPVLLCYNQDSNKLYTSFNYPIDKLHEVLYQSHPLNKNIEKEVRGVLKNFKSLKERRDDKLDDLLKL